MQFPVSIQTEKKKLKYNYVMGHYKTPPISYSRVRGPSGAV